MDADQVNDLVTHPVAVAHPVMVADPVVPISTVESRSWESIYNHPNLATMKSLRPELASYIAQFVEVMNEAFKNGDDLFLPITDWAKKFNNNGTYFANGALFRINNLFKYAIDRGLINNKTFSNFYFKSQGPSANTFYTDRVIQKNTEDF